MFPNNNQAENTVINTRAAVRRKLLGSLIAGSGALVLAACGGGGSSDSASPEAVANRAKRGLGGASSATAASAPAAASGTASTGPLQTTVGEAIAQMQLPHMAYPNGVPLSYQWAAGPVISESMPPAGFTAMTGWGEIQFAAGAGTTAAADTAQLRNFRVYVLDSSGALTLVQNQGSLDGSQYLPTFADDTTFATQMTNASGVTTVTLNPTQAFQFCPDRVAIPAGVQGVVVTVEAQISAPAGVTDPNINNSYILALGADWWQSMTATWNGTNSNFLVGSGRFVYLTTSWQSFTFTSIPSASAALAATTLST